MRAIQECALDLFDERGFDAVTIEEIAAAAEVSPSSVYRYFGTKEGILVADEFDRMGEEEIASILNPADLIDSLIRAVQAYESSPAQQSPSSTDDPHVEAIRSPWRRVRYFFAEPSVRMAALAALDRASQRLIPLVAASAGTSETQARVISNALAFGYFSALEQWYLDGGSRPIASYVEDGMKPLHGIWQQTDAAMGPDS
jgi:AcrR family transcriptional regulator